MGKLEGKVAIVTGAARGIGRGIALRLAQDGAAVVVADVLTTREDTAAGIVAQGGKALATDTDVSQAASVQDMVRRALDAFGQIDVLVNNAAVESSGPLEDVKEEEWDRLYDTNIKGLFLCCKYVLPHMKQRRSGRIIAIGSATSIRGFPHFAAYSGTKGAVLQLVRSLALETREFGIRVNCVCPGMTDTEMGRHAMINYGDGTDQVIAETQMRWGQPEDIANAVAFVASDDAEFMVGSVVNVDGGLTT